VVIQIEPNENIMKLLTSTILFMGCLSMATLDAQAQTTTSPTKPRLADLGVKIGILPAGKLNAITDVAGVKVGHVTRHEGKHIHTGMTAILPHSDNVFQNKVPAAISVGNGFGKLAGYTQVEELGEIETPILLTNTLNLPEAIAAITEWTMSQAGNENVASVNAVVGETNDGYLNDIRSRNLTINDGKLAINKAKAGVVEEGSVGAGAGTRAFNFKGGIGTSSRVLPASLGGYTVGVVVQSNFDGVLNIAGVPVGKLLGRHYLKKELDNAFADGSIMIVIATDAPLSDRNLKRLANRAFIGVGRTGSPLTNGSGDYAIAFSTALSERRTIEKRNEKSTFEQWPNDRMSPLFQAVTEAAEEAVINSLLQATSIDGHNGIVEALPLDKIIPLLKSKK
jgi:D-aminopeptidase